MELQFMLEQFDAVEKTARHETTGLQWLRLHASTAGIMDLIPHALRHGQKKTEKETDTDTYFLIISPNAGDKGFQVMLVVKDLSAYSGDAGSCEVFSFARQAGRKY